MVSTTNLPTGFSVVAFTVIWVQEPFNCFLNFSQWELVPNYC